VQAVPEGRVVFAGEPLLEVTAPIAEAQLAETVLLNHVTFQTAVTTKAARCVLAARGAQLVDFSFRRTQGIDAGLAVARASAIAGFTATSNVAAAARRYQLAAAGTMAHSFIEAFGDEQAAFIAFAEDFAGPVTFLVDTYDTGRGVRNAIEVARRLRLPGPVGVRLDSGDLAALARMARTMLDEAGLAGARIFASGGLDEYAIAALAAVGAPIDAYGVGTKMGVSADAPYLDSAYKLAAYDGRPVMKLSAGKTSPPGAKQVYRGSDGDVLALRDEPPPPGHQPLLVPVMRQGRRGGTAEPLAAAQQRCRADLAWLPPTARSLIRYRYRYRSGSATASGRVGVGDASGPCRQPLPGYLRWRGAAQLDQISIGDGGCLGGGGPQGQRDGRGVRDHRFAEREQSSRAGEQLGVDPLGPGGGVDPGVLRRGAAPPGGARAC
jgi:nicotinate phosphoribosyltransferase